MISYLKGEIIQKKARAVTILAGGVGWQVFVGPNTLEKLKGKNKVVVFTHFYVREDAQELYGFLASDELNLFELLLSVGGVGPRSAQLIVDTLPVETIVGSISEGKSEIFTRIPGIGGKISQRIIIDLEPKLKRLGLTGSVDLEELAAEDDAVAALSSLGYRQQEAERALKKVPRQVKGASRRVEEALKILGRK